MDREQSFVSSAFSVYATEVRKAIGNQQSQIDQLQAAHDELQQTLDTLEQLPAKLRHEVMVPMGTHAFFPGHLTRTNEFTVHLGDQYYAEVTAQQARGILQRRQAAVADGISKAQQQLKALQARLDMFQGALGSNSSSSTGGSDPDEAREIRSSLAESDALLATAPKRTPARGQQQQQHHQPAADTQQQQQRVVSASGYAYKKQPGLGKQQRTEQQEAEDAELQARLEQLLLLEEEEQQQDMLGAISLQQQQQHAGLDSIAEGEEDEGEEEEGQGMVPTAVEHLEQQEAEADSDDEDEERQQLHPPPQQQQQQQQPAVQQQQQPAVQQQQPAQKKTPLKPALKKGFFGPASSSSSSSRSQGSSRTKSQEAPASTQPKPTAFTGTVVERVSPPVAAEEAVEPVADTASGGSSSTKPMSKFKLRRMGLEPQLPE